MPKLLVYFKGYLLNRLQLSFPKLFKIYKTVRSGTSRLTKDSFTYYKVKKSLKNEDDFKQLEWHDLLVYNQLPKDWKKIAPVFFVSAFPIVPYVVLPIAYMYPHKLLSQQFWSQTQKLSYYEHEYHKNYAIKVSIKNYIMQNLTSFLTCDFYTEETKYKIKYFIDKFNSTNELIAHSDLLNLNRIFSHSNLNLSNLPYAQLKEMIKLFGYPKYPVGKRVSRLMRHVYVNKRIDECLLERDISSGIDTDHLLMIGFQRGLNPKDYEINKLTKYIQDWIDFSSKWSLESPTQEYYSTYLYAIILLSLNFNKTK